MTEIEGSSWTADDFGEPTDVLSFGPRTWADPPSGAVLVEVAAAGVGLPDLFMVQGRF
jgi:NADPH2:quinone reductase